MVANGMLASMPIDDHAWWQCDEHAYVQPGYINRYPNH